MYDVASKERAYRSILHSNFAHSVGLQSNPPFIDWYVRLTAIPFKHLSTS